MDQKNSVKVLVYIPEFKLSIKAKDIKIEMILRKALWEKGYCYRKNYSGLPGHPDLILTKYKIAIFCDGQ